MPLETVFIVSRGERCEGSSVVGVYSDKEMAVKAMREHATNVCHKASQPLLRITIFEDSHYVIRNEEPFYAVLWDTNEIDFVNVREIDIQKPLD